MHPLSQGCCDSGFTPNILFRNSIVALTATSDGKPARKSRSSFSSNQMPWPRGHRSRRRLSPPAADALKVSSPASHRGQRQRPGAAVSPGAVSRILRCSPGCEPVCSITCSSSPESNHIPLHFAQTSISIPSKSRITRRESHLGQIGIIAAQHLQKTLPEEAMCVKVIPCRGRCTGRRKQGVVPGVATPSDISVEERKEAACRPGRCCGLLQLSWRVWGGPRAPLLPRKPREGKP